MRSPLLFLVFNRPEPTRRVFEAIRAAQPPKLYVAADGARAGRPGEAERCALTRQIATQVDWPCELHTLLRDHNLGCRRAVSGAIDWFFSQECEGIILEDDCLPAPDFFRFCDDALQRYRDEPRVMHVGGHGLVNGRGPEDALLSHLVPIWGWATWARAWAHFDSEMKQLPRLAELPLRQWYGPSHRRVRRAIEQIHHQNVDAWGARWALGVLAAEGFAVLPRVNLISNIGFGADATHTTVDSHLAARALGALPAELKWPARLQADTAYDRASQRVLHDPWQRVLRVWRRVMTRLRLR